MFVESIITMLIYVCLLVLCAYLVVYVLGVLQNQQCPANRTVH